MRYPRKASALEEKYGKPIRDVLIDVLEHTPNNSTAARELGISPSHLCHWLQRYQIMVQPGKRTAIQT
jgi:transcriptional regulator with GAF, ATPase, and Fis domain